VIRLHNDAFRARIDEHRDLSGHVFDAEATGDPEFYVVVYADNGYRTAERLSGAQDTATFRAVVHSVGTSPRQARWVAERVFEQVLGYRLTVPGRLCTVIRHTASLPVQNDPDLGKSAWYCVDEFAFDSDPA
jgi:hypothetical protein